MLSLPFLFAISCDNSYAIVTSLCMYFAFIKRERERGGSPIIESEFKYYKGVIALFIVVPVNARAVNTYTSTNFSLLQSVNTFS